MEVSKYWFFNIILYTPTGSMSEFMHLTAEERQLNSHSRFMLWLVPNNSVLMGTY